MSARAYLDWNASAPLRPEARAAMAAAMDLSGNPSSVHAEGRAARAMLERARAQVARLAGCAPERVVFTGGATEANNLAIAAAAAAVVGAVEHASVLEPAHARGGRIVPVGREGRARFDASTAPAPGGGLLCIAAANGETGVVEDLAAVRRAADRLLLRWHCDLAQAAGRAPVSVDGDRIDSAALSAHKLGGPKGIGALVLPPDLDATGDRRTLGGGQERGWRAGTENLIGAAGFGAAAEAALRDLEGGVWDRVAALRDRLEERLVDAAPDAIVLGAGARRLPNTSCIAAPGWAAETQVIAMDLAGYAISAGPACASGAQRRSHVPLAMGLEPSIAGAAIRISLGPATTETDIDGFACAWTRAHHRRRVRAA